MLRTLRCLLQTWPKLPCAGLAVAVGGGGGVCVGAGVGGSGARVAGAGGTGGWVGSGVTVGRVPSGLCGGACVFWAIAVGSGGAVGSGAAVCEGTGSGLVG